MAQVVRIRAKRNGFRRCGVAHSSEWKTHPAGRFSDEEIEQLKAEPMLQVEIVKPPKTEKPGKAEISPEGGGGEGSTEGGQGDGPPEGGAAGGADETSNPQASGQTEAKNGKKGGRK